MFQHEKLTDVERGIIKVFCLGAGADLRARKPSLNDPAKGATWGANRTVSAEFLVALLTGELVPENGKWRGVTLQGARITGHLSLATEKLVCRLELQDCFVAEAINLYGATASYVGLPGCHVPELMADHIETSLAWT